MLLPLAPSCPIASSFAFSFLWPEGITMTLIRMPPIRLRGVPATMAAIADLFTAGLTRRMNRLYTR